jgi:pyruvate dehydrogenase E2 component (dihydrolipoamide acetyltransferase)
MAEIVRMPKMSDTMTEGVIAKWHKKVGDTVKSGELMAEIETDKATMDYESFNTGTVLVFGCDREGEAVQINDVLAIVGNQGEDFSALLAGSKSVAVAGAKTETPKTETVTAVAEASIDTSGIKAEIVLMPKMSDTMNEGVIAAWHKKVGDTVKTWRIAG